MSAVFFVLGLSAHTTQPDHASAAGPARTGSRPGPTLLSSSPGTLVNQYCVGCHNDRAKTGGLTLAQFDPAHPEQNPDVAEKMVRKLRAGMMPPPGARRPDPEIAKAF